MLTWVITSIRLLFLVGISTHAAAQRSYVAGMEFSVYPAGQIVGIFGEAVNGNHHGFNLRLAANRARRQDFSGLNDDERGWGPGFSLGYRYYPDQRCSGFFGGLRADLWQMNIHWKDSSELVKEGSSKITILQPTLEIGYEFDLPGAWRLSTAFVNGFEVNVRTHGEEVGQGWITLWQFRLARRLGEGSAQR